MTMTVNIMMIRMKTVMISIVVESSLRVMMMTVVIMMISMKIVVITIIVASSGA